MRARSQLLASALVLASSVPVHAGQVSHSTTFGPLPVGGTHATQLPQFDGSLGVLRSVRLRICPLLNGTAGYENTSAQAATFGWPLHSMVVGASVPWTIGAFGYPPGFPGALTHQMTLAPYDGVTDWAGASGVTLTYTDVANGGEPCPTLDLTGDAQLQTYVGAGQLPAVVGPIQVGTWNNPPSFVLTTENLTVSGTLTVEYAYDPFPAGICAGIPGAGCPCGNHGWQGAGCGNSLGPGGLLAASGTASIAGDTLVLIGSAMTNSNALYFQGTSFQHAQSAYGDGLRCVTGSVVRLGTRTNVAGASQVPNPGGTPISLLGGVVAPGTRFYQVVYRDNAGFCTSSTFNATSGQAVRWSL